MGCSSTSGLKKSTSLASGLFGWLNPQQRRAVEYGCEIAADAPPLLIIAGAGSGKTNTLAHRVAHLIVRGADPRRIMLLTFSRRAAAEMQKRVERITGKVMGAQANIMTDALTWSGTFHAIGARLLGNTPTTLASRTAFTIHDRERFRRSHESRAARLGLLRQR